jgi:hypothetical protein
MTSAPTATRFFSPLVAVIASLVCAQAACSLTSLDYLKNGERRDGALGDTGMSSPDMAGQGDALLDATHWDSVDNHDGPILDGLLIDGPGEIDNSQGTDASTPDTALLDDARPEASIPDAPSNLDGSNPANQDAPSGADTASGGTTGTADAVTSQGGAGADGNTATGGQGGAGTAGSTDAGDTSLMDGGEDEDTAAGGQGGAGTAGSTGTGTGGAGGTGLLDGGGDTATGGQGEVGMDASMDAPTCSGVLHAAICWYLGPQGNSCQQVCASHGAPAPDAASHVGTAAQGGSNAECKVLLGLLGISGTPSNGLRLDGRGLGCSVYVTTPWWLTSPNFSVSSSEASSRLVCGCTM